MQTSSGGLLLFGRQAYKNRLQALEQALLALHASAARTSTHVFIVIMVTPSSFLRKSGPVKTGPT